MCSVIEILLLSVLILELLQLRVVQGPLVTGGSGNGGDTGSSSAQTNRDDGSSKGSGGSNDSPSEKIQDTHDAKQGGDFVNPYSVASAVELWKLGGRNGDLLGGRHCMQVSASDICGEINRQQ